MLRDNSSSHSQPFVIGVAGGTASGKGTFAQMLADKFPDQTTVVGLDNYYQDQADIPLPERLQTNVDNPTAFDFDLALEHLQKLLKGEVVTGPAYDYTTRTRTLNTIPYTPTPLLIVEGLLALYDLRLLQLYNLKVYLEADADLRLARRVLRDIKEKRHETLEYSVNQYLTSARPQHKIYVAPQKEKADLVVDWNEYNPMAVEQVVNLIKGRNAANSSHE